MYKYNRLSRVDFGLCRLNTSLLPVKQPTPRDIHLTAFPRNSYTFLSEYTVFLSPTSTARSSRDVYRGGGGGGERNELPRRDLVAGSSPRGVVCSPKSPPPPSIPAAPSCLMETLQMRLPLRPHRLMMESMARSMKSSRNSATVRMEQPSHRPRTPPMSDR